MTGIDATARKRSLGDTYGPATPNAPNLASPPLAHMKILLLPFFNRNQFLNGPNVNVAAFCVLSHSANVVAFVRQR